MNKLVFPGEYLGTEEEYIPGSGTYLDEGRIYSASAGRVSIGADFRITVVTGNEDMTPQQGDEIIGVVTEINDPLVVVSGEYIIRKGLVYETKSRVLVHASRIVGQYLDTCSKVIKVRDVIMGKVISTRGKIDLTLENPDYGVIYAYCSKCRRPLERINSELYCTYCQKSELRKVSRRYGEIPKGCVVNENRRK
ncbi:MAG: exosome complex RNA-binding protein Csl4 [Thermoplasmatales archaeon]